MANYEKIIQLIQKFIPNEQESPWIDKNGNQLPEIINVGKSLNDLGGYDLMLKICKSIPQKYQRSLEFAWSGIGDWQA